MQALRGECPRYGEVLSRLREPRRSTHSRKGGAYPLASTNAELAQGPVPTHPRPRARRGSITARWQPRSSGAAFVGGMARGANSRGNAALSSTGARDGARDRLAPTPGPAQGGATDTRRSTQNTSKDEGAGTRPPRRSTWSASGSQPAPAMDLHGGSNAAPPRSSPPWVATKPEPHLSGQTTLGAAEQAQPGGGALDIERVVILDDTNRFLEVVSLRSHVDPLPCLRKAERAHGRLRLRGVHAAAEVERESANGIGMPSQVFARTACKEQGRRAVDAAGERHADRLVAGTRASHCLTAAYAAPMYAAPASSRSLDPCATRGSKNWSYRGDGSGHPT